MEKKKKEKRRRGKRRRRKDKDIQTHIDIKRLVVVDANVNVDLFQSNGSVRQSNLGEEWFEGCQLHWG